MKNSFNIIFKRRQFINIIIPFLIIMLAKLSLNKNINEEIIFKSESTNDNTLNLFFGDMSEIKINYIPLLIYSYLPFKKDETTQNYIFENLLFNLHLKTLNEEIDINDLGINATITDKIENCNYIENLNDTYYINTKFDLSTQTVALSIDTQFMNNIWNSPIITNKNDQPIFCANIYINNNEEKIDVNIASNIFIYNNINNTDYIIGENFYVNDKLYLNNDNDKSIFKLYHLKLKENNDKFQVDFCSNYALNRGIYVSFLDNIEIKNLQPNDLKKNSTNVIFSDSETKKGSTYHFDFSLKDNKKDIYLIVYTTIKKSRKQDGDKGKNNLPSLDYIIKYSTYNSNNKIDKYILNNDVKYTSDQNTTITIQNVKKKSEEQSENNNSNDNIRVSVRKIKQDNSLNKELYNTIGIIESKYEMVKADIKYDKDNIIIKIPKIDDEKEHISIMTYFPEDNEKFVYNTIHTKIIKKPISQVIIPFVGAILFFGLIIGVIIYAYKHQQSDLKTNIMKTSFVTKKISGPINEENEEGNLLE